MLFDNGRTVKISDMAVSRKETQQSMTEFTRTYIYISPG